MTNAAWWASVVQAHTGRADLLPQRVWALRRNGREAAIDLRAVPGIGAELVLSVNGDLLRTRLYRAHEQAELSGAIADIAGVAQGGGLGVTTTTAERVLLEPHRRGAGGRSGTCPHSVCGPVCLHR